MSPSAAQIAMLAVIVTNSPWPTGSHADNRLSEAEVQVRTAAADVSVTEAHGEQVSEAPWLLSTQ